MKLVLSKSRTIDFRVSTLPTLHGEKIVLRILDPASATYGIEALGLCELVEDELHRGRDVEHEDDVDDVLARAGVGLRAVPVPVVIRVPLETGVGLIVAAIGGAAGRAQGEAADEHE